MHLTPSMSVAGFVVGVIVGLTGMGGGALMTPILVLFFGTTPSAAVSSDLVTSLFMKPVGGAVHWRRATVHKGVVGWLLLGAVPAAFAGVFVLKSFGSGDVVQARIKLALGAALLLAFTSMVVRQWHARRHVATSDDGMSTPPRPLATVVVGLLGGLVVGMTSVGSGSLIIVTLMWLYPRLSNRVLVGTDLVQAVPLVGAAALGHVFFGDVKLAITASLLIGSLPGVYLGARISSRTTAPWLRPILASVLLASALKLLQVPSIATGAAALGSAVVLIGVPVLLRRRGAAHRASTAQPRQTPSRAHLSKV